MHGQALGCVELSVAVRALEVLALLMLYQSWLIYKLSVAVEAPRLLLLLPVLFLATHVSVAVLVWCCGNCCEHQASHLKPALLNTKRRHIW
jgi:hypothetical protein